MQDSCRRCHAECRSCEDGSASCGHTGPDDPPCRNYHQDGQCVPQCSSNHYVGPTNHVACLPCHAQCLSCRGPTQYHCNQCRLLTVYGDSTNSSYDDDGLANSTVQDVRTLISVNPLVSAVSGPDMAMGWVDPWVGLGWVGSSSVKYELLPAGLCLEQASRVFVPRRCFVALFYYL